MKEETIDTHSKALRINLDPRWYGTFAEIGAGQEVVRWFFRVGGAAGWMGIKFQSRVHDQPSQIVMHLRMLDAEASLQQEALGIVGVNLCYGAFFLSHMPEQLIESLLDKLTTGRVEIDLLEFTGIEFRNVDNRIMALKLVQLGLSGAAMFGPNREVLQPSDELHNKAVLVERGSFRPTTHVNLNMLNCALEKFKQDPGCAGKQILPLMELTMRNLLAGGTDVDRRDFLARAELLAACGMTVLISDYFEYHRLAAYLAWRTKERIGVVMGLPSVSELFDEKYYAELPGGILENFGRLFKNDLKIYVYPLQRQPGDELQTIRTLKVNPELQLLYDYLVRRGSFVQLDNFNPKYLSIFSRDVLKRIATGDESWDEMVPPQVAAIIRERGFFGYTKKE